MIKIVNGRCGVRGCVVGHERKRWEWGRRENATKNGSKKGQKKDGERL